jgi:phosphate acetyltransferase
MATSLWHTFRQKASRDPQRILFAEGEDPRVVKAAKILIAEKIAIPWLVGPRPKIETLWRQEGGRDGEITSIDPQSLSETDKKALADEWLALPKNRKQTPEEAREKIQDPLVLGCLYLKRKAVDGFVGGAVRTTADTLRAVFTVIGLSPEASTLFGFFLMERKTPLSGCGPLVLLGDCAVIPDPSAKQLANIAVSSAAAYQFLVGEQPRVAFLSFSTHGSASHPFVDKMTDALKKAREKAPGIAFEGEWQADAALDPFTASIKGVGHSAMAGKANVLIAPDLNCGNIAYKLAQRMGDVRAVGPVLWGTAQPANDLSRGCSVEDIVDMAALTAIQAQAARLQPALAQKENPA